MKTTSTLLALIAVTNVVAMPVALNDDMAEVLPPDALDVLSRKVETRGYDYTQQIQDEKAAVDKYHDNLAKQIAGNCGEGCQNSINSFQSKNSAKNKEGVQAQVQDENADLDKYESNLAKQAVGNCGKDCEASIASYQSRHSSHKSEE